jgi:hypothetical protein
MGNRVHKIRHDENTRMKIKTAMILRRLTDHLNSPSPLLDASQVSAAKILLSKVLPDLNSTELTGNPDAPIRHVVEQHIVDPNGNDSR